MVSASVKSNHFPLASAAPHDMAWHLPDQPAGNSEAAITFTLSNRPATSAVRSAEWSSTTMISARTPGCVTNDARHGPRFDSSLRAGMITETSGRTRRGGRDAAGFAALRGTLGFLP